MLTREGMERTRAHDLGLACFMATVAGALNVAGFRAVGVFSANMTGNVSAAADHLASGEILPGLFLTAVVAAFIAGAAASSFAVAAGKRRGIRAVHALAILFEAAGLAALGLAMPLLPEAAGAATLVLGLGFLLGFQNAVVTRISGARVRTTHVSGMATDIGIGFGALLELASRGDMRAEARPLRESLVLHGSIVVSFCAGGALGALIQRALGVGLLLVAAGALFALSAPSASNGFRRLACRRRRSGFAGPPGGRDGAGGDRGATDPAEPEAAATACAVQGHVIRDPADQAGSVLAGKRGTCATPSIGDRVARRAR